MSYDDKKTFENFEREIQSQGQQVIAILTRAEELFKDLSAYKAIYGTNQDIADKLGVDVTWIDALETAVIAMHRLFDAGEGVALTTGNYFDDLRRFT